MSVERILDLLSHPKQTKPGSWATGCPCCRSREGRPLAVTETSDGRILMYAFCGCSTEDVLSAIGLTISDLFDKPLAMHMRPMKYKIPASQVINALEHEANVLAVIAADMVAGKAIDGETLERLTKAAARINTASAVSKATK